MVLALIVPEIGKVNCVVTWPWRTVMYKVTRKFYTSICYAFDFPDPKNLTNKQKDRGSSPYSPEILNVTVRSRDLDVQGHAPISWHLNIFFDNLEVHTMRKDT